MMTISYEYAADADFDDDNDYQYDDDDYSGEHDDSIDDPYNDVWSLMIWKKRRSELYWNDYDDEDEIDSLKSMQVLHRCEYWLDEKIV